jgi:methyl halide transferase
MARRGALHGNILVPGCGSGHDARAIAAASQTAQVVGIDIAPSALDQARRFSRVGQELIGLQISSIFLRFC